MARRRREYLGTLSSAELAAEDPNGVWPLTEVQLAERFPDRVPVETAKKLLAATTAFGSAARRLTLELATRPDFSIDDRAERDVHMALCGWLCSRSLNPRVVASAVGFAKNPTKLVESTYKRIVEGQAVYGERLIRALVASRPKTTGRAVPYELQRDLARAVRGLERVQRDLFLVHGPATRESGSLDWLQRAFEKKTTLAAIDRTVPLVQVLTRGDKLREQAIRRGLARWQKASGCGLWKAFLHCPTTAHRDRKLLGHALRCGSPYCDWCHPHTVDSKIRATIRETEALRDLGDLEDVVVVRVTGGGTCSSRSSSGAVQSGDSSDVGLDVGASLPVVEPAPSDSGELVPALTPPVVPSTTPSGAVVEWTPALCQRVSDILGSSSRAAFRSLRDAEGVTFFFSARASGLEARLSVVRDAVAALRKRAGELGLARVELREGLGASAQKRLRGKALAEHRAAEIRHRDRLAGPLERAVRGEACSSPPGESGGGSGRKAEVERTPFVERGPKAMGEGSLGASVGDTRSRSDETTNSRGAPENRGEACSTRSAPCAREAAARGSRSGESGGRAVDSNCAEPVAGASSGTGATLRPGSGDTDPPTLPLDALEALGNDPWFGAHDSGHRDREKAYALLPWPSKAKVRAQLKADAWESRGFAELPELTCPQPDPTMSRVCGCPLKHGYADAITGAVVQRGRPFPAGIREAIRARCKETGAWHPKVKRRVTERDRRGAEDYEARARAAFGPYGARE